MYYDNASDQLNIRQDIFSKLISPQDVAAAQMHEAIYKIFRERAGASDSKLVRRLVGCLFSESETCLRAGTEVPRDRVSFECSNSRFTAVIYPEEKIHDPRNLAFGTHVMHLALKRAPGMNLNYLPEIQIGLSVEGETCLEPISDANHPQGAFTLFGYNPIFRINPKITPVTGLIESASIPAFLAVNNPSIGWPSSIVTPSDGELKCKRLN